MARKRAFEEEDVMERAMELFWARGFESTSISDLEEHLQIGRQSLYNTFGDKKQLFHRALDLYSDRNRTLIAETLLQPTAGLPAIRAYLDAIVQNLTTKGRKGCLLANSALECDPQDKEVRNQCRQNERKVTGAFRHALGNAVQAGELPGNFDPGEGARILMAHVYGLTVLSKTGAAARELRDVTKSLLDRL